MSVLGQIQNQLKWEELPAIPDQSGFAGMFAGVSGGALICMGGANFPDAMPWEGGKKIWYDNIYILDNGASAWKLAPEKLPRPIAYGVSFTYKDRIILAGGSDANRHYADVFSVGYANGKIQIDSLAPLPFALANMTGTVSGDYVFIAGGTSTPDGAPLKSFLAMDLRNTGRDRKWVELESWPGPARMQAVSASLRNVFFLFSGIDVHENDAGEKERVILNDAYKFLPDKDSLRGGQWIRLSDMPRGVAAGASPAPTVGTEHVLFPGGLESKAASHKDPASFPGFVTDLLAYHVQTDSFLNFGNLPDHSTRVTVPAVKWNDRWVIVNGEAGPGKRSPKVFSLSRSNSFGWLNWLVLAAYLSAMVWIGFVFDKEDQTTSNFFTASGKIPWWAAGLSIFGTQMSAITFMAIPAIVFATDWSSSIGSVMILLIVPFVVKYYVPFFRRLNITSAYEYLEHRFNANIRSLGSISFILFQLCRMGIVLYLPAVAIASVTGIDVYLLIVIMGVICVSYTVMGGIEAVIWTDVIQVVILLGGAILCLVVAIGNVGGGIEGVIAKGMAEGKFKVVHWGWGYDQLYFWVAVVGFFFLAMIPYTSDQAVVQRYVTVKDERSAAQSLYTNGFITLPGLVIFFGLGTVLYLFYRENPGSIPSEEVGEVLPYFIVHELPAGVAGLIIAGMFAASQSTLSGSMNSISAAYTVDIHARFWPGSSEVRNLRTAKIMTFVVGIFGIGSAMIIAALNIEFIFDLFQEVLGIFGGSLAGVFIAGVFTKRINAFGVVIGFFAGVVAVGFVKQYTDVSVYLYAAISVVGCVVVSYLASLFFPQNRNLRGLTYSTLEEKEA